MNKLTRPNATPPLNISLSGHQLVPVGRRPPTIHHSDDRSPPAAGLQPALEEALPWSLGASWRAPFPGHNPGGRRSYSLSMPSFGR